MSPGVFLARLRAPGAGVGLVASRRAPFLAAFSPIAVTAAAAVAFAILAAFQILLKTQTGSLPVAVDVMQGLVAPTLIVLALVRQSMTSSLLRYPMLALSITLAVAGMIVVDLAPYVGEPITMVGANTLFTAGSVCATGVILPALYRRLDRRMLVSAGLDGVIVVIAALTVILAFWGGQQQSGFQLEKLFAPLLATAVLASAGVAVIAALSMRAEPRPRGVWCGILGVYTTGGAWIVWLDRSFRGASRDPIETMLFAGGLLLLGYAWITWNERVGQGALYERIARGLADWLPNVAIVVCITVTAFPRPQVSGLDPVPIGTVAVVVAAVARQRLLLVNERETALRLAREVEERAATMWSLARLDTGQNVEGTAERICAQALRLDGIVCASVYAFAPNGGGVALASLVEGEPGVRSSAITDAFAVYLRANASLGPWVDSPHDPGPGPSTIALREAFAPMRWEEELIGVVAIGAADRKQAVLLAERLPTVAEFGVVASAMLGPTLSEHWRHVDLRRELEHVISTRAFVPVFQPIVDLHSGAHVGYEALTRFVDGARPDVRFVQAGTIGMSVPLELACLAGQIDAAGRLPDDAWLSVNVSPALVAANGALGEAIAATGRQIVVEVTEHVEIADYRLLAEALDPIRNRARLAVDDAGAGYAGLRHILELKPHYVKLDISLVRSIDTDAARQAMVAGMAHFARNAGCELIAEGIETNEELDALIRLGVSLGQGYLLGKPKPIE